ncbi:DsbA family protein [Nocardia callitridis]|uniref:Thioredoxin domain-containing protein n=1 Tax=Nocardia callitridis TaxID=648753 RepID=A0ABP9JU71_9NOCA
MSTNRGAKNNPLLAASRADRNRTILIQVAVAVVLIALIAAIGIGIAVKKSEKDAPGATPQIPAGTADVPASLTDNGSIRLGKPDAKATVRVVADLQCPACQGFEGANAKVIEDAVHNGTAAVEYNLIAFLDKSSSTQYSSRAANASYCVAESDPAKYLTWLTSMYTQQPPEGGAGLTDEQLIQIAEQNGYTDPGVAQCITDRKFDKYVQARTQEALGSGIKSTPSVFINGKQLENSQDLFTPGGIAPAIAAAAK